MENILGCPVVVDSLKDVIGYIGEWIVDGGQRKVFVCANPHSLVVAKNDSDFLQVFQQAELVTPDGAGIVLASKILNGNIRDRITGSDIFKHHSQALNRKKRIRYFFLGSSDETLAAIKIKMAIEYPNISVETFSPPYKSEFSEEDNRLMIEAINAAKPDVLWVGMTAPKQEKWIFQNKDRLDVKFIGAIGAVFDFYVGNVKRSHPIFQRMGLEWLPRLCREPRRLFRRNFISSPKFLWMVMKQKFGITRY
ncbi:MAG: WecB/TagA/CpsF family glycosyltransferase [Geopsychrobacter sp.]|nr:WecB/TagA/CpsF family glycosyltransferase [Geopsychrobacter sp.]